MSNDARHRDHLTARKRTIKAISLTAGAVVLALVLSTLWAYRHLEGNITAVDITDIVGTDRPEKVESETDELDPLNILLLGSDERQGQAANIGGESPGLSDTTIVLHLSADRERAYGVSIPRDSIVDRPDCYTTDGSEIPGESEVMFNTAYAVGGPGCTQRTVEQLTGIRIDHFAVVKFDGFKDMVDALGGVEICVPTEVDDRSHGIYLPEGTYEADGTQALNYVRVRHVISENGDIGRMKRQQAFLASMANEAISAGTLINPHKLYKFLDAATKSLITDSDLANLRELSSLANEVRNLGPENIKFMTVPWEWYEPDPNRVVWAPEAAALWRRLEHDKELTPAMAKDVIAAADEPAAPKTPSPRETAGRPSPSPSPSQSDQEKAAAAAANGLCA